MEKGLPKRSPSNPPVNRQTLLKTLPSLAVGNEAEPFPAFVLICLDLLKFTANFVCSVCVLWDIYAMYHNLLFLKIGFRLFVAQCIAINLNINSMAN